jgi:hypothetical protein
MIFDKWKSMTMQLLIDEVMRAKDSGTYGGLSLPYLEKSFDTFSYDQAVQYKAYAVYDGEKPQDLTKLIQVCNGV